MRKKFAIFLFIYFMSILEVSFFSNLFPARMAPDIILIMIIIWSAHKYFESVWIWSVISGFIFDFMSFGAIGAGALLFLTISVSVEFLAKRFFIAQRSRAFFMITFFVLGGTIINYFYWDFISQKGLGGYADLIYKIISNLIAYPFIYYLMVKLRNILQIKEHNLIMK